MDLKAAIKEVMPDFNESFPPVWLHYNAATSHFRYYSEKCPPPLHGNIIPLHDSSTDSSSQEAGQLKGGGEVGIQPEAGQPDGGEVASNIFGNAVQKKLQGMNAKHYVRNLEFFSIS